VTRVVQIAASILNSDLGALRESVQAAEQAGVDRIHLDIMDGHFVPNITFGLATVEALRSATTLPFDAHLMVQEPSRWAARFAGYVDPHRFAGPEETEALLHGAGFAEARCWLQEAPVHPPEPPVFLGSVILGVALERLPEDERDAFVADVLAGLPEPFEADYVRLNIDAIA